jgi:hypothetical protein
MARSSEAHVVVTEQTPLLEAQVPDEDAAIIIQSQDAATVKDSSKKGIWLLCPLFIGMSRANALLYHLLMPSYRRLYCQCGHISCVGDIHYDLF